MIIRQIIYNFKTHAVSDNFYPFHVAQSSQKVIHLRVYYINDGNDPLTYLYNIRILHCRRHQ